VPDYIIDQRGKGVLHLPHHGANAPYFAAPPLMGQLYIFENMSESFESRRIFRKIERNLFSLFIV